MMMHTDVTAVKADECQYGLKTRSKDGTPMPALKPTKFMTNAMPMAELLQKRCKKDHEHQPLVSGRCAAAAFYPLPLIRTFLKGIRRTKDADVRAQKGKKGQDRRDTVQAIVEVTGEISTVKKLGGGKLEIKYEDRNFKEVYRDEYTSEILPTHLIRAAIKEELNYFNERVWEITETNKVKDFKDGKVVRCRWVLCNKG